jgi:hypothetical protein
MRFSEGFFAAWIADPYVAYKPCESSVRGQIAFRTPSPDPNLTGTLLLDYPDFDLGVDIGMEPDWNPVDSECPNWLVQLDLPLLDREPLCLELVRDVR